MQKCLPIFTANHIVHTLYQILQRNTLIHNITNMIVTQFTANILLSLGALTAMINTEKEVDELIQQAKALIIHLGTINAPKAKSPKVTGL